MVQRVAGGKVLEPPKIAQLAADGESPEVHGQSILPVLHCQLDGVVNGIVGHGEGLLVHLQHTPRYRVHAVRQIADIQLIPAGIRALRLPAALRKGAPVNVEPGQLGALPGADGLHDRHVDFHIIHVLILLDGNGDDLRILLSLRFPIVGRRVRVIVGVVHACEILKHIRVRRLVGGRISHLVVLHSVHIHLPQSVQIALYAGNIQGLEGEPQGHVPVFIHHHCPLGLEGRIAHGQGVIGGVP